MKVALCTIVKNENLYLKEYVTYYKHIGFDKIFLYDNNDIDGEHIEDVINDDIQNGFVDVINYRGKSVCQLEAYDDCYHNHSTEFDYIAFFDCDEFLLLQNHNTIQEFLQPLCSFDSVHINWVNAYNFNDYLYYKKQPITKQFKDYIDDEQHHIKSIYKTKINHFHWNVTYPMTNPHYCPLLNCSCCDSTGNNIPHNTPWINTDKTNAVLIHYKFKSLEEYCHKIQRGYPDQNVKLTPYWYHMKLNDFFSVYEYTDECKQIIYNILNYIYEK